MDFVKRMQENKNDSKFNVEAWREEIQNTLKIIWAKIDYKFYTCSSSNPDGCIALSDGRPQKVKQMKYPLCISLLMVWRKRKYNGN